MVCFTCQHCGDSVTKPKVDKHYDTKCRYNKPYLTCVDCLKDFNGNEYSAHTQCVTEAERYAAKGTVIKQPAGRQKQAEYTEIIKKLLTSNKTLTNVQRELLNVCSSHDNVPKKLNKFKNFMNNAAKNIRHSQVDLESVFNLLETAWNSYRKEISQSSDKTNGISDCNSTIDSKEEQNSSEINGEDSIDNNTHTFKKTKSKKGDNTQMTNDEEMQIDNNTKEESKENVTVLSRKELKKQKKREKYLKELKNEENEDEEERVCDKSKKIPKNQSMSIENGLDDQNIEPSKAMEVEKERKQKKSKKQKKYELVCAKTDETVNNEESHQEKCEGETKTNKKKSKKSKKKLQAEFNGNLETDNAMEFTETGENSKKVNKRKLEKAETETTAKKKKTDVTEDGDESQTVFDWTDVILRVLEGRPDKELSIKRLGKKVIDEYQTVKPDHRSYEDLLAKFHKKVKKTKGVRVLKDKAKLIE